MPTKYPTTDRVTAGRLIEGDQLLVRNRATDQLELANQDEVPFLDRERLAPGIYTVRKVTSHLVAGWSKSSRYYTLTLVNDRPERLTFEVTISSVQRLNRVT
jgi:hypothetical protein